MLAVLVVSISLVVTNTSAQDATTSASTSPTSIPSTYPTTSSAAKSAISSLDLSSPLTAAYALRSAIRDDDEIALRELLAPYPILLTATSRAIEPTAASTLKEAAGDPRVHLTDSQASLILASRRLADVMHRRFGDSRDKLAAGAAALSSADTLESALSHIEPSQLKRVGDDFATLPVAGDPQGRITFRRVSRDASGQEVWHVELLSEQNASTTRPATPDVLARAAFMRDLAIGLNEAAEEIDSGRRRTLDDARATIVEKFHSTIARSIDHPSTKPATTNAS